LAGGRLLVEKSYADARLKVAEQQAQRAGRRTERRASLKRRLSRPE
jgi:hypothetical protein